MLATIDLDFDPNLRLLGAVVRLEAVALAGVVVLALAIAAIAAGRTRFAGDDARRLRRDDLLLVALGAIPGAVVGGRIGYVLIHLDYYSANPGAIFDASTGSLSLTVGIVLGTIGALAVARLLDAPIGRWLQVAALPLLVALGLGKLAMVLGGAGQGRFADGPWSTRYVGPGPWESALAGHPAVASQVIEGVLVLAAAVLLLFLPLLARFRMRRWWRAARPGWSGGYRAWLLTGPRRFIVAIVLWAVARFVAVATWRDAEVLGFLRTEQVVLLAVVVACIVCLVVAQAIELRRARGVPGAREHDSSTIRNEAAGGAPGSAERGSGVASRPIR